MDPEIGATITTSNHSNKCGWGFLTDLIRTAIQIVAGHCIAVVKDQGSDCRCNFQCGCHKRAQRNGSIDENSSTSK